MYYVRFYNICIKSLTYLKIFHDLFQFILDKEVSHLQCLKLPTLITGAEFLSRGDWLYIKYNLKFINLLKGMVGGGKRSTIIQQCFSRTAFCFNYKFKFKFLFQGKPKICDGLCGFWDAKFK